MCLCGRRNVSIFGEICKKRLDFDTTHFTWMLTAIEDNETTDPCQILLLRAIAVVAERANRFSDLVQKPRSWFT